MGQESKRYSRSHVIHPFLGDNSNGIKQPGVNKITSCCVAKG
jgi:hypothetical protein